MRVVRLFRHLVDRCPGFGLVAKLGTFIGASYEGRSARTSRVVCLVTSGDSRSQWRDD